MAITPEVIAKVEECIPLGPLHNPPNLVGIRIAQELFPGAARRWAVFDTAFHQTMPPVAYTYPVPYEWLETARRAALRLPRHEPPVRRAAGAALTGLPAGRPRLVTAISATAAPARPCANGKSVDTTMGLTPLEGVMMGTRSGSVDPAIIGHVAGALASPSSADPGRLNKKSGPARRVGPVERHADGRGGGRQGPRAGAPRLRHLLLRARQVARALVVPLGRLDALVFTGGIGENSVAVKPAPTSTSVSWA